MFGACIDQPGANRRSIAAGFLMNSPTSAIGATARVAVRRCVAMNNNNPASFGFGFSNRQIASNNTRVQGDQYLFEECIADSNLGATGKGAGFDLNSATNSKILNCISQKNNIGIFVNEDVAALSANNIVAENTIVGNTENGIKDATSGNGTAYYSNVAKKNGATPASTNYAGDGFPATASCGACVPANGTPVRYWSLPGAPCALDSNCVAGEVLDNMSIVN